ncbi:uncharacterized protein LOC112567121 [Pomacea canaliculata]|uniref:uncharacterized protein LOC112567121 n=1 Tax=Pomacea canaliculata TaxID=400727 RepID=UPI000D72C710|nr:uncharacterized protein LOC112567121 [Pomacea canaliculata]
MRERTMASEQLLKIMMAFVVIAFCLPLGGDVYVHGIECYHCYSTEKPGCSEQPEEKKQDCVYCRKVFQEVHFKSSPTVGRECIDEKRLLTWDEDDKKLECHHIISEKSIKASVCLCDTDLCNRGSVLLRSLSALHWTCALFTLFLYFCF